MYEHSVLQNVDYEGMNLSGDVNDGEDYTVAGSRDLTTHRPSSCWQQFLLWVEGYAWWWNLVCDQLHQLAEFQLSPSQLLELQIIDVQFFNKKTQYK